MAYIGAYIGTPEVAECADEPTVALDRLADIARTAERAADMIQKFLDRFHGTSKVIAAGGVPPSVPVSGYCGQIDRLSKAVQECDDLSRALRDIG